MEIIFVLAATAFVFALFILAFFVKGSSEGDELPKPTCARCDCHRNQEQHARSFMRLKKNEKSIRS
jgi:hypothetical protein